MIIYNVNKFFCRVFAFKFLFNELVVNIHTEVNICSIIFYPFFFKFEIQKNIMSTEVNLILLIVNDKSLNDFAFF